MTNLTKRNLLIKTVSNCTDLRILGHNLNTGKKAFFSDSKTNQGYKVYMTNNGKSIVLYIKQKGKNVYLENDSLTGEMYPHKLKDLLDWFVFI